MSNPPSPAPGSPQEWLEHARSDLKYARLGESDPDVLPNQAAFHAQQAAEKALNPYAFETRYPGYIHQVSRQEVRTAIAIAAKVMTWAEATVNPPPTSPSAAALGCGD
jgi:hypothetical protein